MSNIINAILNLVNNSNFSLNFHSDSKNRANQMGDALENYVKDMFAGSFGVSENEKIVRYSEAFSYLGNNSNPPDAMLKNGDAIEIKKIEKNESPLALNSSHPKHKLKSSDAMISSDCKNAEIWQEKDIIYTTGVVNNNKISSLCMVYGTEFCAKDECYSKIKNLIKNSVESCVGIEFSHTRELGRVNKIDPLGITYLRIRGMWGIENPWKVFSYIYTRKLNQNFNFMAIISQEKWNSFNNTQELVNLSNKNKNLKITDTNVKNPNNPALLIPVKLVEFSTK